MRSRASSAGCAATSTLGRSASSAPDQVRYLFLDGWYPRIRIGKKRVRMLVTLGACADGRRLVLDLRLAGEESEASWREALDALTRRRIGVPSWR